MNITHAYEDSDEHYRACSEVERVASVANERDGLTNGKRRKM